jgi:hypothetical protein
VVGMRMKIWKTHSYVNRKYGKVINYFRRSAR